MKKVSNVILAMVLFLIGASAFGWNDEDCKKVDWNHPDCKDRKPPTPTPTPPPVNATGTGYGGQGGTGTGYGGHGTADAAASAWQTMNAAQRAELTAKLTSEQRTEVMTAINSRNENKWENYSPSNASSSLTGNVTTVAYQSFSRNLNLASALSPEAKGDVKMGEWSKCGPRYVLPKDKDGMELSPGTFENKAHVSTLLGVGWKNIPVQTIVGPIPPFDVKEPVREVRYNLGPAMASQLEAKEGYFLYGHKMMIVAGVVANSGASNFAGQGGSQGNTLGLGNSAGNGIPQVGAVIAECQIDSGVIKVKVTPPTMVVPPIATAPVASEILLVEEKETVLPTGTTWRVGDACRLPGANCKKVEGTPGERTTTIYASECVKPASPEVAMRCAQAKGLLGKPPTVTKEVIPTK